MRRMLRLLVRVLFLCLVRTPIIRHVKRIRVLLDPSQYQVRVHFGQFLLTVVALVLVEENAVVVGALANIGVLHAPLDASSWGHHLVVNVSAVGGFYRQTDVVLFHLILGNSISIILCLVDL